MPLGAGIKPQSCSLCPLALAQATSRESLSALRSILRNPVSAHVPTEGSDQSTSHEDSSSMGSTIEVDRSVRDPQAEGWLDNYVVSNPRAVYVGTQFGGREAGQSQNGMPVFARVVHYNNEQIYIPRRSLIRLYLHPIDEYGDKVYGMRRTRSAWDWINAIPDVIGMDADQVLSWRLMAHMKARHPELAME